MDECDRIERKSRFYNGENLDLLLNANTLNDVFLDEVISIIGLIREKIKSFVEDLLSSSSSSIFIAILIVL